jgi:hypothetical protein
METYAHTDPQLPVHSSVAGLLLLVLANRRSVSQLHVTECPERWANAIEYCRKLGWELDVDEHGTVTAANVSPAPKGFDDYFLFLRHKVCETQNFKAVVRSILMPRLAALVRERSSKNNCRIETILQ